MNRLLVVGLAVVILGCDTPYWVKQKREDAQIARQDKIRAEEHQTWRAEERRRLLALCLDISKFERQWGNFASWSFDQDTGECEVSYKKTGAEKKTPKQCADEWLTEEGDRAGDGPSDTAKDWKRNMYFSCVAETFSRQWNVQPAKGAGSQ